MTPVAGAATPVEPARRKSNKAELESWAVTGDTGENSRMKVQNVAVDSTVDIKGE